MKFSRTPEAQGNRKFWLLYVIALLGIVGAYYGGYRMGRWQESEKCNSQAMEQRA